MFQTPKKSDLTVWNTNKKFCKIKRPKKKKKSLANFNSINEVLLVEFWLFTKEREAGLRYMSVCKEILNQTKIPEWTYPFILGNVETQDNVCVCAHARTGMRACVHVYKVSTTVFHICSQLCYKALFCRISQSIFPLTLRKTQPVKYCADVR